MLSNQNKARIKNFPHTHDPQPVVLPSQTYASHRPQNGVCELMAYAEVQQGMCKIWGALPDDNGSRGPPPYSRNGRGVSAGEFALPPRSLPF